MDWDPDDSLRLFFGLRLTDEVRPAVVELQARLQAGVKVKWVEPENLHFTLKFLGEMPALVLGALKAVAGHVARETHPWDLNLSAVGAFPQLQHPQTIFVGTGQGAGHLTLLADKLTKALEQCDLLSGDQKPFVAHCTLGRCKQERGLGGLVAALEAEAEFQAGPMSCHEFALWASELTQAGPKYTEIASFTFSPRPEAPA